MLTVGDLCEAMEAIAPLQLAEPWDRVGLAVGEGRSPLRGPVLLTIDLTEAVLAEAVEMNAGAIVSYHPPIWDALDRLVGATHTQRIIAGALRAGIAIYSPHTALDAAEGGLTDWLCEGVAGTVRDHAGKERVAGDVRALSPRPQHRGSQEMKIVCFVPEAQVVQVRNALATAGAGRIGLYEVCSFSVEGEGTFLAGEGSHPVLGERGRLETVRERRLEMVCSRSALALAIETLRQFHPYEEPAIDVYELVPEPQRRSGPGRRVVLDQAASVPQIAQRLATFLGPSRVKISRPAAGREGAEVQRIAVVPGAGASLLDQAIRDGCDAFVTGEMKHHEVLRAMQAGVAVVLAGHTNTERGYLPRLADRLRARLGDRLSGTEIAISRQDRDPLVVVSE